ncbi:MAG: aminopeptidase P family protein [Anaerolineaceae bacterium]|nr:aminopeptidase P family protein [Anaerolineaceae bacterium]
MVNIPRLLEKMNELDLDGLVATTIGNVYYFTGVYSAGLFSFPYDHQSFAVISRDQPTKPTLITSKGLSNQALDGYADIQDVVLYGEFFREGPFENAPISADDQKLLDIVKPISLPSPAEALAYTLEKMNLQDKRIGIDEINIKPRVFQTLCDKFPRAKFKDVSLALRWVRKVKTPDEIERLRKVSQINEAGILAAMGTAKEGVTEVEMVQAYEHAVISAGGQVHARWLRFGAGGVAAERKPGNTKLEKGEPIFLDLSCAYQGYYADFGRVGCLREPDSRLRKIYHALLEGHKAAVKETCPGMTGNDVFEMTVEAVRAAGLSHYKRHHVGHGIGLELYEDVLLAPGVNDVIEEGTVVNAESPYYEFGLGGLIVEDPFVVRSTGNELLTTLSQDLLIA